MLDWYVSLFPVWIPDVVVYGLAGLFIAGVLLILFPLFPVPPFPGEKK